MITQCAYCNEPLQEEEIEFYRSHTGVFGKDALPLCTKCGIDIINWSIDVTA